MVEIVTDVPLCSVVHICTPDVLEQVKQAAFDFLQLNVPDNSYKLEDMLPTQVSATGQAPVTNYLCFMPSIVVSQYGSMIAYRDSNNVPSELYQVTSLEDFLTQQGLVIISGV